jgi:hypothetical protein
MTRIRPDTTTAEIAGVLFTAPQPLLSARSHSVLPDPV